MITIIPAIDIIEGKCVRLSRGDYATKKVYNQDPLEVAKQFEASGITRLHLVDLDGAREQRVINWKVLETLANRTELRIDFSGGIRSDDDVHISFECGAKQITAGSIAVIEPQIVTNWLAKFGNDKIILGADIKEGKIAISGWQDSADIELLPFLENYHQKGIRQTICTDISRDGMLSHPAFQLYREIKAKFPKLAVIASGGVSSVDDIWQLQDNEIDGVIIGKAIYEGRIRLEDLNRFLC
jgi:phosphoribosylformimino-5-aminoimidazole carboxamide ribotide isomerase